MKLSISWRWLPLIVFLVLIFFLWRGLSLDPHALPSVVLGKKLPYFNLPSLDPEKTSFKSSKLHGDIVLLNIWASWCSECAQEQVFLMQLARSGVLIYGLNYKDDAPHARAWLKEWGNPYVITGSDPSGRNAMALGVYGAPETFLINSDGVIIYRHAGPLNRSIWRSEFLPRMQDDYHV